jgi:GT2 family glycosyltransferase
MSIARHEITEPEADSAAEENTRKLRSRVEQLHRQNKLLVAQKEGLERAYHEVLNSKSWRLTAPLRALAAAARTARPLLRFGRFSFKAGELHGLKSDGEYLVSCETSPSCELLSDSGRYPSGWVLIRPAMKIRDGHMYFALNYRSGEDFSGENRVFLPVSTGTVLGVLARLPDRTAGLRLDPFISESGFAIVCFEIREIGKLQLLAVLAKTHIGPYIKRPGLAWVKLRRAIALVRRGGLGALKIRLFSNQLTGNYQDWVKSYDTLNDNDRREIKAHVEKLEYRPVISVVMPTWNTPERWLRKAVDSVRAQLYPHWELCIADDASTDARTKEVLREYAAADGRIKVHYRDANGHIAAASNDALALATGEFVALLDHDDELSEHALYHVACELQAHRDSGLLYSDEDKIDATGMRFNAYFKCDWNPELMLSQNYVCHLSVFRRALLQKIGGFRQGVDGAQDWDLILRASRELKENQIRHLPRVLYHWRVIEGSTAQSTAYKPYVLDAQARTVREHLEAGGVTGAEIEILRDISHLRVRFPVPSPAPLVSIIIPTRDRVDLLGRCVETILEKSDYEPVEIIIVDNGSEERETLAYFDTIQNAWKSGRRTVRVIRDSGPFIFSRINNAAVKAAKGELIGFLNNDLEVISPGWLSEMVSHAARKEVGAVGARLIYPNDTVQHAGVILGIGGVAGHSHKGQPRSSPGYWNRAILVQNLSAVTAACLLMRREIFEEIDGFDESLIVAFNDIDLCLRITERGYRIVFTPYAELYHFESASRGYENTPEKFSRFEREIKMMKKRWKSALSTDPFYNPNLTLLSEDFGLAYPPRLEKPWRAGRTDSAE